ncbi:MAG: hypothetical protein LBF69_03025, partial [Prevotellaceae bacterium]|nr:hypothetical protein [Prevotellaceae bacterium]
MKMIKKLLMTVVSGLFFSVCVAQDLTVCSSSSYTIPSIQGAGSAASYQWTENGVDIPGAVGESYTNMTGKTTTGLYVYVRMAYTESCERQASNGVIVQVIGALSAPVIQAPANGCEGANFVFTVPDAAGITYEWTGEGASADNSYVYAAATPGEKTVTVRAVAGIGELSCTSPYSSASVTVYSQPEINLQPVAMQEICPRSSASLSVSAAHATSYLWLKNGVPTTEGSDYTTSNYTTGMLTAAATYQVVVSNDGICSATSEEAIVAMRNDCCDAPGSSGILFSKFNPCANAPDASTWTLTDQRDGKTYKVKKLADGRYWMVQDLKFGKNCTENSFANDDSRSDAVRSPTVDSDDYVGHCRTSTVNGAGYLYNWAAAMKNANGYWGSSDKSFGCTGTGSTVNQCQGICPEGWHVPTRDEFSNTISTFTNAYSCSKDNCWNASSKWEGVSGGYCHYS